VGKLAYFAILIFGKGILFFMFSVAEIIFLILEDVIDVVQRPFVILELRMDAILNKVIAVQLRLHLI
jgi:hypothetical protein